MQLAIIFVSLIVGFLLGVLDVLVSNRRKTVGTIEYWFEERDGKEGIGIRFKDWQSLGPIVGMDQAIFDVRKIDNPSNED